MGGKKKRGSIKGIQMAKSTNQFGDGKRHYKTVRLAMADWQALKLLSANTGVPMMELLAVAIALLYTRHPEHTKHLPADYRSKNGLGE